MGSMVARVMAAQRPERTRALIISGCAYQPERSQMKEWGERFGMTHFVNPKEVSGDLVQHLVALRRTRALCSKANDEALRVTPKRQQSVLASQLHPSSARSTSA